MNTTNTVVYVRDIGSAFIIGFLIISFVALTIASTAELSERQGFSKLLADNREQQIILQTPQTNSPLREILVADNDLKELIYLGADWKTLYYIRTNLDMNAGPPQKPGTKVIGKWGANELFDKDLGIASFSNFILIAIAVLSSGACGGILASVRRRQEAYWWGVIKGFGIGFVVYLFIRSSKSSYFGDPLLGDFNPTTSCFFAAVCGLFFEQSVELMQSLFKLMSARVSEVADEVRSKSKNKILPDGEVSKLPCKPESDL